MIGGLRRAPGTVAGARLVLPRASRIDPRWVSFLVSKPALADDGMPRWVRWLQPLLSGVFTVDNLDYVRRDAHMTGVATDVDVERLRRYAFIGSRGLTLYEPGLGTLEQFLTARLFMYQQVYFHRTVRAIDLDLAEVFGPSIRAMFGDGLAGRAARRLRRPRRVRAHPPGGALGPWRVRDRASPSPGDGPVTPAVADGWRAILLRQPRWRAEAEIRAEYEPGARPDELIASLGPGGAGPRRDRRRGRRRATGRRDGDRLAARAGGARRDPALDRPRAGPPAGLRDDRPPLPPRGLSAPRR